MSFWNKVSDYFEVKGESKMRYIIGIHQYGSFPGSPDHEEKRSRYLGPDPKDFGGIPGYGPEILQVYNQAKELTAEACEKCCKTFYITITGTNDTWTTGLIAQEPAPFGDDIIVAYDCDKKKWDVLQNWDGLKRIKGIK